MKNFCIFADAVNFIEENLCSDISQEDIAAACYCSLSSLQKVWRYCTHTSVKEYIEKRRLVRCAEDILNTDMTLTEIAMKYRYNSPEVFTRAFRRLWGVSPSKFKSEIHSSGIFPRIIPDESRLKGGIYMGRRVDITELYNELQEKKGSYVLCFDVAELSTVNKEIGHGAGDRVILEAFRRVDGMAGDSMPAFRIGGDEFAVVTGLFEKEAVESCANKVIELNGQPIEWEGRQIAVSLRVGAVRTGDNGHHIRYHELFDSMQRVINESKGIDRVYFFEE